MPLAKSFEGSLQYRMTTSPASKEYYLDQVLAFLKGQIKKSRITSKITTNSRRFKQRNIKY